MEQVRPIFYYRPGEQRRRSIKLYDRLNPNAEIALTSGQWAIYRKDTGELVDSGACTVVDRDTLTWMLRVDDPGVYCLEVTAYVGSEELKPKAEVICDDCH